MTVLFAVLLSAFPILLVCRGDPKRIRAMRGASPSLSPKHRRALLLLAALPGIAMIATGDSAALLMWLGSCALVGCTAAFVMR